jgi:hypothetical protein
MTHLTNISEEASLVLVSELISALEQERQCNGQPSLVTAMKAAIAQAWSNNAGAAPGLRIGQADAQLVLEWVEQEVSDHESPSVRASAV